MLLTPSEVDRAGIYPIPPDTFQKLKHKYYNDALQRHSFKTTPTDVFVPIEQYSAAVGMFENGIVGLSGISTEDLLRNQRLFLQEHEVREQVAINASPKLSVEDVTARVEDIADDYQDEDDPRQLFGFFPLLAAARIEEELQRRELRKGGVTHLQ